MFKGYKLKDIFYSLLGSIIIASFLFYITDGGWGEPDSSQSPKVIHKQQERTVTEDVLKEDIENCVFCQSTVTIENENKVEQLSKTESKWLTFEGSAYVSDCKGCTGFTYYKGYDVRNTIYFKGYRVIATDPNVVPLGSLVKVKVGDNIFKAVAIDIGSAIKGNDIDLLMETRKEALRFGRKPVQLIIIEKGKF